MAVEASFTPASSVEGLQYRTREKIPDDLCWV